MEASRPDACEGETDRLGNVTHVIIGSPERKKKKKKFCAFFCQVCLPHVAKKVTFY